MMPALPMPRRGIYIGTQRHEMSTNAYTHPALRYRIEFAILNAIGALGCETLRLLFRGFGLASYPSIRGPRLKAGSAIYSA